MSVDIACPVNMSEPPSKALLSICIPTYNRSKYLENLLINLVKITEGFENEVEVCVSNNASTDSTRQVIDKYSKILDLKILNQTTNIGATPNAIEVVRLATGRWILIIGDDDEFWPEGFKRLLEILKTSIKDYWFLVGVTDPCRNNNLLIDRGSRLYSAQEFRFKLLKQGLFWLGFIGMHVFPSSLKDVFLNLTIAQSRPWPHLALILRNLTLGNFRVVNNPVVIQSKIGDALFWNAGDWAVANLDKLKILTYVARNTRKLKIFFLILFLRELYCKRALKEMVFWKIFEPEDFKKRSILVCFSIYGNLGFCMIFAVLHFIFIVGLFLTPITLIEKCLFIFQKSHIIDLYLKEKMLKKSFNGVDRGL